LLNDNNLSGSIPFQLGNISTLITLRLDKNQLSGNIPASLWTYPSLDMMILSNNQLEGSIPVAIKNLSAMTFLDLSNNKMSGTLPVEIGELANLNYIILENNQFDGAIPVELGNMSNLTNLNLRNNHFSGTIPASLGNILYMQSLDLSGNQLTGDIPDSLASLIGLADPGQWYGGLDGLYLDYNQLNVPDPYPSDPPTALQTFLLQKDPDWQLTQSVSLPVSASGGTLISRDNRTEISIPADAITTSTTLQYNPQLQPQYSTGALLFANTSFELLALDEFGDSIPQFEFELPVSVTLHYTDLDIEGMDEITLKLYYWDIDQQIWSDAAESCDPVSEYQRDLVNNSLSVEICHLNEFALMGKEPIIHYIFLPILLK